MTLIAGDSVEIAWEKLGVTEWKKPQGGNLGVTESTGRPKDGMKDLDVPESRRPKKLRQAKNLECET